MISVGKLAKLASGSFSPDDAIELLSGMGVEVAVSEVPEDRKADAFQRVAQFSMLPGSEAKHVTLIAKDGSRMEALVILKIVDQSNDSLKKSVDKPAPLSLLSCQST